MRRKYFIMAAACMFLLIAGICYSCVLKKDTSGNSVWNLSQQQEITLTETSGQTYTHESEPEALGQGYSKKSQAEDTEQENQETSEAGNSLLKADTGERTGIKELAPGESTYAHICGAVSNPGVYPITEVCRVVDLVELAGGFTEEAAEDYINQALKVQDGQRIYIPTQKELKELSAADYMSGGGASDIPEQVSSGALSSKLININTATAEELMKLPGVGEAKAASILEYRNTKGKFITIQDLMKISGIKEGLFEKVSGYITVK